MTRAITTVTESFDLSSLESADIASMIPDDLERTVLCDATAGPITLTLPTVNNLDDGRAFFIKKIDSTDNIVTLAPVGGELIDGQSSFEIKDPFVCFTVESNGLGWFVI